MTSGLARRMAGGRPGTEEKVSMTRCAIIKSEYIPRGKPIPNFTRQRRVKGLTSGSMKPGTRWRGLSGAKRRRRNDVSICGWDV